MIEPAVTTEIWKLPDDAVFAAQRTSPQGLTEDEAFARLAKHGKNVLPAKVSRPIIFKFIDQFTSLFAIMLEAAAVLVFIAAMLSTGASRQDNINVTIAILAVVLLNATIGFFQEYKAEKATEALQKLVPANAKAIRDGEVTIVAAADLVPGDIIVLEEGDSISARRPPRAPVRALDQQHRPHRRVGRGAQDRRRHRRRGVGDHQHAEPRLHGHERGLGHRAGRRVRHRPADRVRQDLLRSPPACPTRSRRS